MAEYRSSSRRSITRAWMTLLSPSSATRKSGLMPSRCALARTISEQKASIVEIWARLTSASWRRRRRDEGSSASLLTSSPEMRSRSSAAAALVNVITRKSSMSGPSGAVTRLIRRSTRTRVLPEPAAAAMSRAPPECSAAALWAEVSSSGTVPTSLLKTLPEVLVGHFPEASGSVLARVERARGGKFAVFAWQPV